MGFIIIAALWFFAFIGTPIIASNKHRSVGGWLIAALLFGVFAFFTVMLLPTLPNYEAIDAERADSRECPHCLSLIPQRATVCRYCQRDVAPIATVAPIAVNPRTAPRRPLTVAEWEALEKSEGHVIDCTCPECNARRERVN